MDGNLRRFVWLRGMGRAAPPINTGLIKNSGLIKIGMRRRDTMDAASPRR